ncbi:hypothetical protein [Streptosporangium sp. KLBMP 9127]|nr:hypothetical protein [Streptosporangium sp. KLBMP 9127]
MPVPRNQEWLFTLLPAFPLVLLVMRLWYASRQDTQTLLLLVQHVSPLGMLSAVLLTALWVVPAVVLALRALGSLYRISTGRSSWLVRSADRVPDWVVALAVLAGLLGWQLRLLPTLLTLALAVAGLTVRDRYPERPGLVQSVCVAVPVTTALFSYVVLQPAIWQAAAQGDMGTLILLAVPPGLAPLLTGPVPDVSARLIANGVALTLVVLLPLIAGVVVLRAPILPLTAMELATSPDGEQVAEVVVGHVITSDDRLSTLLDRSGAVRFIRNDRLVSKVLCPDPGDVPRSQVQLHRWYVEQSMISWVAPDPLPATEDPRCEGRPAG